jgi:hypothetical protein
MRHSIGMQDLPIREDHEKSGVEVIKRGAQGFEENIRHSCYRCSVTKSLRAFGGRSFKTSKRLKIDMGMMRHFAVQDTARARSREQRNSIFAFSHPSYISNYVF